MVCAITHYSWHLTHSRISHHRSDGIIYIDTHMD